MAQDMGDIIRTEVRDIIDGEEGQEHSSGCVGRCKTQRVGAALEIMADSKSTILPDPMPRIDVEEDKNTALVLTGEDRPRWKRNNTPPLSCI